MASHLGHSRGYVPFGRRIKDSNKPFEDEVVDFPLVCIQLSGARGGWNDGKVIAYLLVVEYPFVVGVNPVFVENGLGKRLQVPTHSVKQVIAGRYIILR